MFLLTNRTLLTEGQFVCNMAAVNHNKSELINGNMHDDKYSRNSQHVFIFIKYVAYLSAHDDC